MGDAYTHLIWATGLFVLLIFNHRQCGADVTIPVPSSSQEPHVSHFHTVSRKPCWPLGGEVTNGETEAHIGYTVGSKHTAGE